MIAVDRIARTFLVGFCLISMIAVLHPGVRDPLRMLWFSPYRKILSVSTGDVFQNGSPAMIVKIETEAGLAVEVYGAPREGQRPLLDVIPLADRRDGYFHFRGQAANLALYDVDGDEAPEIFAPSFDEQMIPHLNVFRYNSSQARFEAAGP